MINEKIEIKIKTSHGKIVAFEKVNGDNFQISFSKNKLLVSPQDVFQLIQTLRLIEDEFDSRHFQRLQWTHPEILPEKLKKLTDDQLLQFAKFDEKKKHHKSTTNIIRTELFARNGISKAGYKLNINQKAFLFSAGLSMK